MGHAHRDKERPQREKQGTPDKGRLLGAALSFAGTAALAAQRRPWVRDSAVGARFCSLAAEIHDLMPVVLERTNLDAWLKHGGWNCW